MAESIQIFVLGDQTNGFEGGLCRLFKIKGNSLLTSFFERAQYALRLEIGHLPIRERELFPRFTSIPDLLARYRDSADNPALEGALTCIHQLGCFVNHYGAKSIAYPSASGVHITGLCTGLLAAAAISSSQTVSDLIPAAIEAVLIAFRVGLRALEVRSRLEHVPRDSSSWSVVVNGIPEEKASLTIKGFSNSKGLPISSRPYVSSTNSNSLTLSGPPSILAELLQTPPFKDAKSVFVPVHAPYHARHLYNESDLDEILQRSSADILHSRIPRIPVHSSASGQPLEALDYGSLLSIALREIFLEPIRWDQVIEGFTDLMTYSNISRCNVVPIATNASQSLASALKKLDGIHVEVDSSITNGLGKSETTCRPGNPGQSKIAIVGFSGRFPEATDTDEFWDLLYKGLDVHKKIPPDRFDVEKHYDPKGKRKNTSQVQYGCFINDPGVFDARFFNMSPREAAQSDPGQRLALMTAYEALEMAGFVPDRTPSTQRNRVGMFYGMTSDDWREVNSGQQVDTYFIPGGNRAFTPGRINYHFKFSGPSISVDTACSSSFAAIHTACNSLWRGDCDTAVAGGTNVMTNPDNFSGLDQGHFLSRTGNCNTFDDGADGYCRADAVGTVIMKRLEDAEADGDPVFGVILGAYTNHSAEAVSMTRPHVGAQSFIFDKVLNESNIDPFDVSYIEMHGTGTQAGDAVEMQSVLDVFSPKNRKRAHHQSLHLGSAKSNVGHSESSSGVTSLIKVLLMMKKDLIPPHCGIKTKINHTFPTDLKDRNIHIAFKPTSWPRPKDEKRRVFLNNFSAAGGNTAILLEDAPVTPQNDGIDPRSTHVVSVSGRTIQSLKKNLKTLASFIETNSSITSLPALSYTTTARRVHHNHRVIVNGASLQEIREGLTASSMRDDLRPIPASTPKICFMFTGQGAQYTGMAQDLFTNYSQFRSDMRRFDAIGQSQGFQSILPVIDGSKDIKDLSPVIVQLGTTCMQMALARLWISWGVKPSVVVGHSLGEYVALNVAGVLSPSDTIFLTGTRARLLEEKCTPGTHAMLAVKASASTLATPISDTRCEIACINSPEETVISGIDSDITILSEKLTSGGLKCTKLQVPFAFHSAQVQPILDDFEVAAQGVTFHSPQVPIISPLIGDVVTSSNTALLQPRYLGRHCRETVNFLAGIEAARQDSLVSGSTAWVEIGPHPICSGMVKSILGSSSVVLPSLRRNEDCWKIVSGSLCTLHAAGIDIQWDEYHRDFTACQHLLQLPAYSWDLKNYWIQYVHDWCLTKGDAPTAAATTILRSEFPTIKFSTTSVQRIVEQNGKDNMATVVMESDLGDPLLNPVLQGHKVNGAALCPSSLYADIALTLGKYLVDEYNPTMADMAMDISQMVVERPLIYTGESAQLFRASATADWTSRSVQVKLYSVTAEGKKSMDHAKCIVYFGYGDTWLKEWKRNTYMVQSRIDQLHHGVDGGRSHKIKRGMAYKLFSALVAYDQKYRGMEEVVLDSSEHEATACVKFQATQSDGRFHFAPYWIDSLGHLAGFVMNANDAVDSKAQVFINHGWDSMRCTGKFSAENIYRTYVKMQPVDGTMYSGDVYIFEAGTIVAIYEGVKFQGVPRRLLETMLPSTTAKSSQKSASNPPESRTPIRSSLNTVPAPVVISSKKSKPVPTQKVAPSSSSISAPTLSSIFAKALSILAEEIGIPTSDLTDGSNFADFGVDSLLSLTVSGRWREELDIDVDSSVFLGCDTVKDLRRFFSQNVGVANDSEPVDVDSSGSSTPYTESDSSFTDSESITSGEEEANDFINSIRETLAEEIGVPLEEITDTSNLAELGMDSLLSLTVLGRLREELNVDLPSDLFVEHTTLEAIAGVLGLSSKGSRTKESAVPEAQTSPAGGLPPSSSVLLQGNPKTARRVLFLFPDGSGSAFSYAPLPKVSSDIAIYGLNCPYMKNPQDLKCSLNDLTVPYLAEIRRRQPTGPYAFGGWSAGGVSAFDAAQILLKEGEQVDRLILLDSPFPIGLSKLPPRLYHFFNSIGLFGSGEQAPPEWLLPHFLAFVDALAKYNAVPFTTGNFPKTYLIWAKDGVCKNKDGPQLSPQPDDTREMIWLLTNRTDFGPNGWDTLVGKDKLSIETMDNANHFTMMEGEKGKQLRAFIKKALA